MGALYLKPLDDALSDKGLFYAGCMDDWVIAAPSRWKLRKAVCIVNQVLNQLKVEKHPDKTFKRKLIGELFNDQVHCVGQLFQCTGSQVV